MPATEISSAPSSTPASASVSARLDINAVILKLPEFWADNPVVWFAQPEARFAVRGLTCILTKFYYCVAALGCADTAKLLDFIEFPLDALPYEYLKERLTKLHTLNPFQMYQAFMSFTLAGDKKPSTLVGKMCSLLPLAHRVHKDECFLFKGFFLYHLPPNIRPIRTHLMGEDIFNPRKLAADEIWQSFAKSVKAVSATSLSPPGLDDSVKALPQRPQSCPAPHVAPCPAPHASHHPALYSSSSSHLCRYHCKHGDQAQHC